MGNTQSKEAFVVATGTFQGVVVVSDFVRGPIRATIDQVRVQDDASAVLVGQLLRVDAWLRTLRKLDEPADFQGVASAARALLESTVDIVLIHHSPADHKRLLAWEESSRLNYAEKLVAYFQHHSGAIPNEHRNVAAFAARDRSRIEALRRQYGWEDKRKTKTRHPDRWTNHSLADDVRATEKFGHKFEFEKFYEVEYRKLCWMVHGSALAVRKIPAEVFPSLTGLLFPWCGDLAILASELVLRHIGAWSADVEKQFDEERRKRIVVVGQTMRIARGQPLLKIASDSSTAEAAQQGVAAGGASRRRRTPRR